MSKNTQSKVLSILKFVKWLVAIALLIVFTLFVSNLLASRRSLTGVPSTLSPGWQIYVDEQLGFSIQYPENWYELNKSRTTSKDKCFGIVPEGVPREGPYSVIQFCVDFDPYVQIASGEYWSNNYKTQQQFFEMLADTESGDTIFFGKRQYTVVDQYSLVGAPAIERIETDASEVEGTEPFYTVSVYINETELGLIRLAMHGRTQENFSKYESDLRQMLESFSLLK